MQPRERPLDLRLHTRRARRDDTPTPAQPHTPTAPTCPRPAPRAPPARGSHPPEQPPTAGRARSALRRALSDGYLSPSNPARNCSSTTVVPNRRAGRPLGGRGIALLHEAAAQSRFQRGRPLPRCATSGRLRRPSADACLGRGAGAQLETAAFSVEPAVSGRPPNAQLAARYRAAQRLAGGHCPIDAGLICRLADHECRRPAGVRPQPALRLLARGRRRGAAAARAQRPVGATTACAGRGVRGEHASAGSLSHDSRAMPGAASSVGQACI